MAEIQAGLDPAKPVLVLAYVTVGEDDRTIGLSPQQMRADPRFVGDGSGPRVDPRGPGPANRPLTGLDPLGAPSSGGRGFASWYLDEHGRNTTMWPGWTFTYMRQLRDFRPEEYLIS